MQENMPDERMQLGQYLLDSLVRRAKATLTFDKSINAWTAQTTVDDQQVVFVKVIIHPDT